MNVEICSKQVELYHAPDGSYPYESWFDGLKDKTTKNRIQARIARLRMTGNLGRCTPVGGGVIEIAPNFGQGFFIYAGQQGPSRILLLCGGDKSTQGTDIASAKRYWADYLRSSPEMKGKVRRNEAN